MNNGWLYWMFLLLAAVMETAWAYALKLMQFKALRTLTFSNFYRPDLGLKILLPFGGYIIFGIANIYLFSLATRYIPLATAFAVWTGASIVLIKISETLFFDQKILPAEILFILLILAGVSGLKWLEIKTS